MGSRNNYMNENSPQVAYLGPEATFSHQAAISYFGKTALFQPADNFEEIFELVEQNICDLGVVPVENSYEGSINLTLDLFNNHDLKIEAEILLRIRNNLMSKGRLEDIQCIYSHPMPIAQCRLWLKKNIPGIPLKAVSSTSRAAQMAVKEPGTAAIGSHVSGKTYGLNIIAKNIEDNTDNVTRFLVVGKSSPKPTGQDKTTLLFFLKDKPGTLHRTLASLAKRNINLTRIESRPRKVKNWEYLFFVDLEGHEKDTNLKEAIQEMKKYCLFLKILGSYPAATTLLF